MKVLNCKEDGYLFSAWLSFLEKNAKGDQTSSTRCCSTVPTATSEASVMMLSGFGWTKRLASARAALILMNVVASSFHANSLYLFLAGDNRLLSG